MKSKVQNPKSKVTERMTSIERRVTQHAPTLRRSDALTPPRSHAPTTPDSAVALVITLILLAVITFMTVTFLVVSRSEKTSISSTADQTSAKFAADAGRDMAVLNLLAPMLAWTNGYSLPGLMVSTNFIRREGFIPGAAGSSFSNVNYDYYDARNGGGPVGGNDALENITNLFFLPRVPVYVTNRLFANRMDFRYYLDLNRNGRFETNVLLHVISPACLFYVI